MINRNTILGALCVLLVFALSAMPSFGQGTEDLYQQGRVKLSIAGSFSNTYIDPQMDWADDVDVMMNELGIQLSAGYFVADALEVGVRTLWTYRYAEASATYDYGEYGKYEAYDESNQWGIALTAFLAYYFPNASNITPYLGVQGGLDFLWEDSRSEWSEAGEEDEYPSENSSDSFTYTVGGIVGVEFLVGEETTVFAEYQGTYAEHDYSETSNYSDEEYTYTAEQWTNRILIGIATFL